MNTGSACLHKTLAEGNKRRTKNISYIIKYFAYHTALLRQKIILNNLPFLLYVFFKFQFFSLLFFIVIYTVSRVKMAKDIKIEAERKQAPQKLYFSSSTSKIVAIILPKK